jgi:hypothetical protein
VRGGGGSESSLPFFRKLAYTPNSTQEKVMEFDKIRVHGHRDKFTDCKDADFERMFWGYNAHRKTPLYAWMTSSGVLLGTVDKDYDRVLAQKDEMQKIGDMRGEVVYLIEFVHEKNMERLLPPPDPDEKKFRRGGHVVGGPPDLDTPEQVVEGFKEYAERQYAGFKDTKFWVEGNSAYMEHLNVRCWVTRSDDLGKDGLQRNNKWSAHVSMIKMWNYDYHDVHVGSFFCEYDAIAAAMSAFMFYQMIEQKMESY